ncbi:hypothetical protein ACX93W_17205 [Paenibacillus sp. CAU 1782]
MPLEQNDLLLHTPMEKVRGKINQALGSGRFSDLVFAEACTFYYSLLVWFKKPSLPPSRFSVYTYHRDSQLKVLTIFFAILIGLEAGLLHFLLSRWNGIVAWAVLALNIYGILYIVALYQSSRRQPHLLNENMFYIAMGMQSTIAVPLDNIERLRQAKPIDLIDKAEDGVYLSYMRFDTPQFEIVLKQPMQIKTLYGVKKTVSVIVFRVDDRERFQQEWGLYREGEIL